MTALLIYIALALVFALGKVVLEKRLAPLDAADDQRRLGDLACSMDCSVYDLFARAGAAWNFSKAKTDADFRDYVHSDRIPPYLHEFLQQEGHSGQQTYQELLYPGGRPPYL